MKAYNMNNAIVKHRFDTGHNADWINSKMIKHEDHTMKRRCYESAYITCEDNINQNNGFFTLNKPLAILITKKNVR